MPSLSRARMIVVLSASTAATAALAGVLWYHWDKVGKAVAAVSISTFLVLAGLQWVTYLCRTQAFSICVHEAGARTPTGPLHGASAATFLANMVVPMYIGGWVRVTMLRRLAARDGPTIGQMVTADGVSLLLEAIITVVLVILASTQLHVDWWWVALLIAACAAGAFSVRHARSRLAHRPWVDALNVFHSRWKIAALSGILAIVLLLQPLRFYIALQAVGFDVTPLQALLAFILTSAASVLPLGPGPASVGGVAAVLGAKGLAAAAAGGVVLAGSAVLAAAAYTLVALAFLAWQRRRGAVAAEAPG